jgi:hypothetical protein
LELSVFLSLVLLRSSSSSSSFCCILQISLLLILSRVFWIFSFFYLWRIQCRGERETEQEEAQSKSFLPGVLPRAHTHTHTHTHSLSSSGRLFFGLHHLQFVVGKRNWRALWL